VPAGARGETRERLAAILAYPPELACTHGTLRQLASAPGLFSAAQIFHNPGEAGTGGAADAQQA